MEKQPLEVQTLYAELLERLAAYEAQRAIGHLQGSFVTKTVKGQQYYYFQHLSPGNAKHQIYLGRKSDALDRVAQRYAVARELVAEDQTSIQRLGSLLRAGGAMTTDAASARVLKSLADAGVFRLGGVLVGTHAFIVIGNMLGARWSGATLRTQDVDVAAARTMNIALPDVATDIPGTLASLEMGFLPVPGLDPRSPSTSFKVRGQGLRVDLLSPARRQGQAPIRLQRFAATAQPLKYLDFLMDSAIPGAVINGGATSVVVPDPARFALHKLIVSGERPATAHAKRDKDLWQASQCLEVLAQERPGDITLAWEAIADRGRGWEKRALAGLKSLHQLSPEIAEAVRALKAQ
ncbi:MAG: GSU2403 family nucleotidyltransferase fold protein [Actinomycetota bacterium]|nr:GSU2403 family nucleotidyltransferase fold protein [Coriobacteriia bacterium]MDO9108669.1 GSU2403 family nucleotidyltransferase fold protein [Coriobacteriia bacterium]MDP2233294.1 GSU2403 family nucleotidyltransferase fold protein [Actinomycetota bacterium]